ncbi:Chromatin modification-related protein eaf1 b [Thalictrum thalictroides]|uniref:Chromatin modification-related protein eaf1 b n=1 Tax=Thalictrum thalictroides TaxID=46969 RepID=A0A7J6XDH1_THATH|nr:Chromatin modification-related protein eaf1 b [Thalictrum thalictroides]
MENVISASQPNRFSTSNVDEIDTSNEGGNSTGPSGSVDPESSCIHVGHSVDGYTLRDQHPALRVAVSPVKSNEDVVLGETSTNVVIMDVTTINLVKDEIDNKAVEVPSESNDNHASGCLNSNNSVSGVKVEEESGDGRTSVVIEVKSVGNNERIEHNDQHVSNTDRDSCDLIVDDSNIKKVGLCLQNRPSTTTGSTDCDPLEENLSTRDSKDASKLQTFDESQLKIDKKVHEDSILEEARSIEAKRKRIAELSVRHYPLDYRRKSQWDFLLEEMAWLANDFMQERLWKTTAAVQISYMAASSGQLRINKQDLCCKQKQIAHTLTKSIMQFWRCAEELLNNDPSIVLENCKPGLVGSHKVDEHEAVKDRITDTNTEMSGHLEEQTAKSHWSAVQEYALRFLKFSRSLNCPILAEAPKTPERSSDLGIVEMLLEDRFSEETLFYTVPPGAMEEYRKSVDNYWSQYEKTGGSMHQEEVETSIYGAVEEFGTRGNVYEEDERDAGAYYLPGAFEGSKSSKSAQKKKKHLHKSYSRSYDVGSDLPYGQFMENKPGTHHSLILGKRPSNNLNVGSIPIKRVRTASRQRVVCAGSAVHMPTKADASSGDTSSYQDDQSTVHGGSHIRKTLEVESTGEFGKQLPFDCTEVSMRPKKKKKAKHLVFKNSINSTENGAFVTGKGPAYEQRWQLNSMVQTEQRDYSRKRLESQAFESNGNSGVFGQHATKRPKISKQLQDTSESITPLTGSVPSPVASQMSNMSNPNKFMKMIGGRERGRKKTPKVPAGQSGSGNQWSLFEDQALVVLVHDMGPNWELVSDAISSTLQFKCIFKNPKECKERHKILMDRSAGDGADSAEDSGSSQPYPSTLPGIPKGSARQLFQRLQGPMEEDTLKHHFEKIISVGKKQHSRKNDNQAVKQITAVHNSHAAALTQVCPNNLNGVILTPLDLCDTTTSSSDAVSLGYQGLHSSGLAMSNQSPTPPALPNSGANSLLQGSSAMVLENSLSSPSAGLNTSSRDGQRYGVPRPSSLPNNESQKVQQYNQMLPGKNIQHSSVSASVSLPADRGVRMLPGGNGMGMMSGMSRGMPMPRPGFQGIGSPAMLNMVSSGSMLPSSGVGMPNPVNMHNGAVSGQANSMMRSREALHMMRSPDEQRQMTMQELQMQATQGNNQCIPPFNGLSTGYSNQTVSSPVQTFTVQNQQQHQMSPQHSHVLNNPHHPHLQGSNHAANPQQQAYMLRIAKPQQRQPHQRIMHQPNQQQLPFASSNATMPHVQPPSQNPISSSLQNSTQIQQQASSQPVSLASSNAQHSLTSSSVPMNPLASQSQQKQNHLPSHGHGRNSQGAGSNLSNQMSKQRQRQQQQHQQPGRNHPQQRQHVQSQQQAKLMKGIGRGNMIMHQNMPIDSAHVNGLSVASGNQVAEKGEQVMHLMQSQGLFSGSGSNPVPPGKPLVAPQPSNQGSSQQKLFSRSPPPSSKQAVQMPSLADNSQGSVPPISSGHSLLASQQPVVPLAMSPSQQQQQPQVRQLCHSQQSVHRMIQQNRQASSDSSFQSCVDEVQVNQQPITSTFHIATSMALSHCVPESTSVVPVSSASSPSQWKAREPLYDLGAPNATSHLASIGNPSLQSSSGAESVALPTQGVCQRQSSGNIPVHSHNVQMQWQPNSQQQKQPPPQQSSPPSTQPLSQQPKLQTQQQPQPNLQSVQGGPVGSPHQYDAVYRLKLDTPDSISKWGEV